MVTLQFVWQKMRENSTLKTSLRAGSDIRVYTAKDVWGDFSEGDPL